VSTSDQSIVSKENLQMGAAFQIGSQFYFEVGRFSTEEPGRITITLLPKGNLPFKPSSLSLSVRPTSMAVEQEYFKQCLIVIGDVVCILAGIFVLADYVRCLIRGEPRRSQ
jgi:hypothetical protein